MIRQCTLEPDEEEIGEVRIGDRVVVGWIGEPDIGGFVGQGTGCGIGGLNLSRPRSNPTDRIEGVRTSLICAQKRSTRITWRHGFAEVPSHTNRLPGKQMHRAFRIGLPWRQGITKISRLVDCNTQERIGGGFQFVIPVSAGNQPCQLHQRNLLPRREQIAPLQHPVPLYAERTTGPRTSASGCRLVRHRTQLLPPPALPLAEDVGKPRLRLAHRRVIGIDRQPVMTALLAGPERHHRGHARAADAFPLTIDDRVRAAALLEELRPAPAPAAIQRRSTGKPPWPA